MHKPSRINLNLFRFFPGYSVTPRMTRDSPDSRSASLDPSTSACASCLCEDSSRPAFSLARMPSPSAVVAVAASQECTTAWR